MADILPFEVPQAVRDRKAAKAKRDYEAIFPSEPPALPAPDTAPCEYVAPQEYPG